MSIEEEHQDVLQNIEFVVTQIYRRHPTLTDYGVLRAYEALVQTYTAELSGRPPKPLMLQGGPEGVMLENLRIICEWRLGRINRPNAAGRGEQSEPIDIPTLIQCLKRLIKSVNKWNKSGGQQGYLHFMTQFIH